MPQVSQEQYEQLLKIEASKARKATLKEAQRVILKAHQDEVEAEIVRLNS